MSLRTSAVARPQLVKEESKALSHTSSLSVFEHQKHEGEEEKKEE
jgi:hypothetical protein